MCSCPEHAAFIGQLRHSEQFVCHQGWSLEVVSQYQYSSTFASFNTMQGGDHEGRQGPSCDLMIHKVIFTGSTDGDIRLRFHEFSSSVRRHNVVLEDKLMKSSKRGMYLNSYVYIPFSIHTKKFKKRYLLDTNCIEIRYQKQKNARILHKSILKSVLRFTES